MAFETHALEAAHALLFSGYTNSQPIDAIDWYYPAQAASDSDEAELHAGVKGGNWGKKSMKGARWVRRGKKVAWSPDKGDWEVRSRRISHCYWLC